LRKWKKTSSHSKVRGVTCPYSCFRRSTIISEKIFLSERKSKNNSRRRCNRITKISWKWQVTFLHTPTHVQCDTSNYREHLTNNPQPSHFSSDYGLACIYRYQRCADLFRRSLKPIILHYAMRGSTKVKNTRKSTQHKLTENTQL